MPKSPNRVIFFVQNLITITKVFNYYQKPHKAPKIKLIMLYEKIVLFLLLILFSIPINAQNYIDSLKRQLVTPSTEKDQINTLQKIGNAYLSSNTDSALIYYNLALEKCKNFKSYKPKAQILNEKAIILIKLGNQQALDLLNSAKEIYVQLNDTLGLASVEKNIGNYYYYQKSFDKTLKQYLLVYDMYSKLEDKTHLGKLLNNMAIVYRHDKKYDRALDIYKQALALKAEKKDSISMGRTLMNMGSLQVYLKRKDAFHKYLQQAQSIFQNANNKALIAACQLSFGQGLIEFNEFPAAKLYLEKAFSYYQKHQQLHQYEITLNLLGRIFMNTKDFKKAAELYEMALSNNRQNTRKVILETHVRSLGKAKFELKEYKAAYLLLEEAYLLSDSIEAKNRLTIKEEMQTKFDVRQKNATLKIQQLKIAKQKQSTQVFMLICGLLSLFLVSSFYAFFQKNKHNKLLATKNSIIENALNEKDLLVKEIHHRVKNNLQFISSLLSLQSRHLVDKNAISALQESRNRVNSMSLLHHNLYQKNQLTNVNMKVYLEQLVTSNLQSYNVENNKLQVQLGIDAILLDVDKAISIGLIINELINNVFKHAFPNKANGIVSIGFEQLDKNYLIEVKDNGKGMKHPAENEDNTSTFGLKLIKLLIKKLNAKWKLSGQSGTHFLIEVPVN